MTDMGVEQRRYERVAGPFDGCRVTSSIETPMRIYDLSEGGCLINGIHATPAVGHSLVLKIDLPMEGWIIVTAQAVYERPGAFAVRFTDMTADARMRLERALHSLRVSPDR